MNQPARVLLLCFATLVVFGVIFPTYEWRRLRKAESEPPPAPLSKTERIDALEARVKAIEDKEPTFYRDDQGRPRIELTPAGANVIQGSITTLDGSKMVVFPSTIDAKANSEVMKFIERVNKRATAKDYWSVDFRRAHYDAFGEEATAEAMRK